MNKDDDTEPLEPVGRHRRSFRDDWDPRAVLAFVIIIGAFVLAGIAIIVDRPGATIPAWVVALTGGIGLYYFKNGKSHDD